MNIALLSYEFPPAVAIGGIGTYAGQLVPALCARGCRVHVFAAGPAGQPEAVPERCTVHRVPARDRLDFSTALLPSLLYAHRSAPFDLIEAPEIGPEGLPAFEALPSVARVLRLHTPSFLVRSLGYEPPALHRRLRFLLGALRRGRWQTLARAPYDPGTDPEACCARLADAWLSPSAALADILADTWSGDAPPPPLSVVPYPFVPSDALLALDPPSRIRTVGFLGRLEPRKGVLELLAAIPGILRAAPTLRFRFIGPSWPFAGGDVRAHLERSLARHRASLEFTGPVDPTELPAQLARVDLIVLPSRWENFPFACWESLAAARAVIGSGAGGMAELIEHERSGLLVPPRSPSALQDAVLSLARAPARARDLALAGRARVLDQLAPARVLPLQLAAYQAALERAAHRRAVPCSSAS